jgi:hypothetical protein
MKVMANMVVGSQLVAIVGVMGWYDNNRRRDLRSAMVK